MIWSVHELKGGNTTTADDCLPDGTPCLAEAVWLDCMVRYGARREQERKKSGRGEGLNRRVGEKKSRVCGTGRANQGGALPALCHGGRSDFGTSAVI